jgi:hypothetical protein
MVQFLPREKAEQEKQALQTAFDELTSLASEKDIRIKELEAEG